METPDSIKQSYASALEFKTLTEMFRASGETKNTGESALHPKERFIVNTKALILLNIPSGKPNRKEKVPARVKQKSQPGPTCFYYALKVGACLQEDYLTVQNSPQRKAASTFRKEVTKIYKRFELLKSWIDMLIKCMEKSGIPIHKELLLMLLKQRAAKAEKKEIDIPTAWIMDFLDKFEKSPELNINTFLKAETTKESGMVCVKLMTDAALKFLCELGDPVKACRELAERTTLIITKDPKSGRSHTHYEFNIEDFQNAESFDKIEITKKQAIIRKAAEYHLHKIFNLEPTWWTPTCAINMLYDLLVQTKQPLVFAGFYGRNQYNKSPVKITSFDHYDVLEFPEDSRKALKEKDLLQNGNGHAITLVGIDIVKDQVYYVDSNDESDPTQQRIVYRIPYKEFCTYSIPNCVKLDGIYEEGQGRRDLDFGYRATCR